MVRWGEYFGGQRTEKGAALSSFHAPAQCTHTGTTWYLGGTGEAHSTVEGPVIGIFSFFSFHK